MRARFADNRNAHAPTCKAEQPGDSRALCKVLATWIRDLGKCSFGSDDCVSICRVANVSVIEPGIFLSVGCNFEHPVNFKLVLAFVGIRGYYGRTDLGIGRLAQRESTTFTR